MGSVEVSRADMENWLKHKDGISDRWIKTGAIAAVIAAVLAFLAWVVPLR